MRKLLVGLLVIGSLSTMASQDTESYRCFSSQPQNRGIIEFSIKSNSEYSVDLSDYKTGYELRIDNSDPYNSEQVEVKTKNSKKIAQIKVKASFDYVTQRFNLKLNKSSMQATLTFKNYELLDLLPSTYEKDYLGCEKI